MSTRLPKLPTWASNANDNVQPTSTEIQDGWPLSQTPPSRQRFNWFFNLVHNAVAYLTRRGISDWADDEDYLIGDKAMGSDLKTYIAIQASTNKDPVSEPTYWAPWALTQDDADTRYALKNGDDNQLFAVEDAVNPKDAINQQTGDDRYVQLITQGQSVTNQALITVVGNRKHINSADVLYEYTVDADFIEAAIRFVSGGGGGGSAGGTNNNGNEDYGTAGGGGGGSGCGCVITLSTLTVGTILRFNIGAGGQGGAAVGIGSSGNDGIPANASYFEVQDPTEGIILRVDLPGGAEGGHSPRGGINSCTNSAGGASVSAVLTIAQFHSPTLFNGSAGIGGFCNGGQGGNGGAGGAIIPAPNDNATIGGAAGLNGNPGTTGGDGFYLTSYPYSLGMGGGGGGGCSAGQQTGGAGGHGAPGGLIMKVQKRNYR